MIHILQPHLYRVLLQVIIENKKEEKKPLKQDGKEIKIEWGRKKRKTNRRKKWLKKYYLYYRMKN